MNLVCVVVFMCVNVHITIICMGIKTRTPVTNIISYHYIILKTRTIKIENTPGVMMVNSCGCQIVLIHPTMHSGKVH